MKQDYPRDKFQVVVVSDHMEEATNLALGQLPITLFTPDFQESMKHKSISYALDHLKDLTGLLLWTPIILPTQTS